MTVMGYVYTLRKQTSHSPKCCMSRNATSAEFLDVQIPLTSSCMTGIHRCPVSSARSVQNFMGRKNKKMKWGNSDYDAFLTWIPGCIWKHGHT